MSAPAAFVRPRSFVFWLYVVLVPVMGRVIVGAVADDAAVAPPGTLALTASLYGVWLLGMLWLLWRLDPCRVARPSLLAAAFVWGAVVATGVALNANTSIVRLATKVSPGVATTWGSALAGPNTEELLKLLGVAALAALAPGAFARPVDGLRYGAACGLGFQVVEDLVYGMRAGTQLGDGWVFGVGANFLLRGILHGLWSHAAYTAIAGYGLAWFLARRGSRPLRTRVAVAAGLFAVAWLLHLLNNAPLIVTALDAHGALGGLMLVQTLLNGLVAFTVVLALYRAGRHEERFWFRASAARDPEVVPWEEAAALATYAGRRKALQEARAAGGWRAVRAERHAQRVRTAYVRALGGCGACDAPTLARRRAAVVRLRGGAQESAEAGVFRVAGRLWPLGTPEL